MGIITGFIKVVIIVLVIMVLTIPLIQHERRLSVELCEVTNTATSLLNTCNDLLEKAYSPDFQFAELKNLTCPPYFDITKPQTWWAR